ncbi:MAG: APC family permease [Solirubrobacteraceae bacterium]
MGSISLFQSIVTSVASSAPGQATAVSIAALIAAGAYGGGAAILITALPMLAIAFAYHRLNLWDQSCGASYVWVGRAISPYLGFMVGWIMLAGYGLGTVSDILPIGPSVMSLLGLDVSSQWGEVLSVTLLGGAITAMAVIGIKVAARFQVVIAAIEYAILLLFCVLGFFAVFIGHKAGTVHPSWEWLSPSGVGGKGSLVAGMLVAVYLFTGWDTALYLNEETEKPERNPGVSAIASVAILAVFYFVLVICLQGVASSAAVAAHSDSALLFIASRLASSPWDKLMAIAVALSVLGTTQAFLMSAARIAYAMGSDRVLPSAFGRIDERRRTPAFATVFFGLATIGITWLYVFSSSISGAFDTVVAMVGLLFAVFYAITGIATAWFYRRLAARGVRNALVIGALPLAGSAVLLYIAARSLVDLDSGTRWGLVVMLAIGVALMLSAAAIQRVPFFRMERATFDPDA